MRAFTALLLTTAVFAQDQSNEDLQKQIDELKATVDSMGKAQGMTTSGGSNSKFYGFIRLDAIYDDSRPNSPFLIQWVRSEDSQAPAAIGAKKNSSDFVMHPRLTRLGFDYDAGKVQTPGNGALTGKVEIDFYNIGLAGQTESREAIRMRHAYLKLVWGDFSLLAGQTADVISPIWPAINSDMVMWNAGNLGDRRPQLRPEYSLVVFDSSRVVLQGEVGLTGADDGQDLDAAGTTGNPYQDGWTSGKPTLQARVAFKTPVWSARGGSASGGEKQNLEIGFSVHRAWEKPDTKFNNRNEFDSTAIGLDFQLPVWQEKVWLKGEYFEGQNLDDVRGGIAQGINTTKGREIRSSGGWAEVGVAVCKAYTLSVGYAGDNPRDQDLNNGGRASNRIWYVGNKFTFGPVETGLEISHWTTDYVLYGIGSDMRYQAYVAYKF